MTERIQTPAGYRQCSCGHTLMEHATLLGPGGVCMKYPCECMAFELESNKDDE